MTILSITANKNKNLDECLDFLEDYIKRPDLLMGFRLPLMVDNDTKKIFITALTQGVDMILREFIAELETIKALKGKELADYYEPWGMLLAWLKDLTNRDTHHAITYMGDHEQQQLMFYKDHNGLVLVENIYTEAGDIVSRLLETFKNSNRTLTLGA